MSCLPEVLQGMGRIRSVSEISNDKKAWITCLIDGSVCKMWDQETMSGNKKAKGKLKEFATKYRLENCSALQTRKYMKVAKNKDLEEVAFK